MYRSMAGINKLRTGAWRFQTVGSYGEMRSFYIPVHPQAAIVFYHTLDGLKNKRAAGW
jgi:hypothetical protein